MSYVHRESTDVPFIRAVESFCRIDGVHLSTHDHPLVAETDAGESMPAAWGPLYKAVGRVTRERGARVLLTGQAGDLVMGNWLDDSLQVAAAVRRGDVREAMREALAWSTVTGMPLLRGVSRAVLAALPPSIAPPGLYAPEGTAAASCLTAGFRRRTAAAASWSPWADDWRQAPPERRSHFRALAVMREMRALQRPEDAPDIDYTHPFAHRPLVEFLMSIPADVLCRPGEPRRLMRRALAYLWPPALRGRRSKSLFGAPWVEALAPLAAAMIARRRWHVAERGWIDRARAAGRLERLVYGLDADDTELRHMILLEHWLRNREQAQRHQPPAA